jgi:hypothetical protein
MNDSTRYGTWVERVSQWRRGTESGVSGAELRKGTAVVHLADLMRISGPDFLQELLAIRRKAVVDLRQVPSFTRKGMTAVKSATAPP